MGARPKPWLGLMGRARPGGRTRAKWLLHIAFFLVIAHVQHTALGAGNNVAARPDGKEAGTRGPKMALGYIYNICYFPWLISVPVLSS